MINIIETKNHLAMHNWVIRFKQQNGKPTKKGGGVAFYSSPRAKKSIVTFPKEMSMAGCIKGYYFFREQE